MMVDSLWGKKQFSPNSECENHDRRALGVFIEKSSMGSKTHAEGTLMCGTCREMTKKREPGRWEHGEFRRFVD